MSEQIVVFGDLHINKDPIRVTECLNFLEYIDVYCEKNKINNIVVLGDVFHTSNNIKNQSFVPIFTKFLKMKEKGYKMFFIVGNHDMENKDNDCLIETFEAFGTFIKKSQTINIGGYDYDFLSYTEDPKDLKNNARVLFTHLAVNGFYYNQKLQDTSSLFTTDNLDQYNLVVSGHLHHMQEKNNLLFVGSPYQTRADEIDKKSYFAVVDEDKYNLVEYNEAPEYMNINVDDIEKNGIDFYDFKNKMVTVKFTKKVEQFVKFRDLMYQHGAITVDPLFLKEEINDSGEHSVNINEGVTVSVTKYLGDIKADGIDNKKLLKCFKEVLKRVKK